MHDHHCHHRHQNKGILVEVGGGGQLPMALDGKTSSWLQSLKDNSRENTTLSPEEKKLADNMPENRQ